ncbi:unnamed protein product [Schistocephalus solidus]|uniref:PAM2 domain-containing protein n=1 Tax=Schistocephalus solidus TaxID=70667 RepID=A0A183SB66_SCHSO|nr:unnamed protein product [Schistocephalus solidus]
MASTDSESGAGLNAEGNIAGSAVRNRVIPQSTASSRLPAYLSGSINNDLALQPSAASLLDTAPKFDVEEVGEFVKPNEKGSMKTKSFMDLAPASPTTGSSGPIGSSESDTSTRSVEISELEMGAR